MNELFPCSDRYSARYSPQVARSKRPGPELRYGLLTRPFAGRAIGFEPVTSSSRSNLCKLLTSAFPQLTARLSSMDVHVDVSLCRVIVTQIVTQLGDHPLRTDQREIFGRLAQPAVAQRAPCKQPLPQSTIPTREWRPLSHSASGHAPQPVGCPIALAVRARSSVSAACSSCACCVPVACLSLPTDDARYVITVVSRRPEPATSDQTTRPAVVSGSRVRNRSGSPHNFGRSETRGGRLRSSLTGAASRSLRLLVEHHQVVHELLDAARWPPRPAAGLSDPAPL